MTLNHRKNLYEKRCLAFRWKEKQKGGFLPILSTLAKPILLSVAGSIESKLLQGVDKKNFGSRKRRYRQKNSNSSSDSSSSSNGTVAM